MASKVEDNVSRVSVVRWQMGDGSDEWGFSKAEWS